MARILPDELARGRYSATPSTASLSSVSAVTGTLSANVRWLFAETSTPAHFRCGTASVVATVNDNPIEAGAYFPRPVLIDTATTHIAAILGTGTGTLFIVEAKD